MRAPRERKKDAQERKWAFLGSVRDGHSLTLNIALHCRSPNPPTSKLRTQGDIASASAALEQLATDAALLLRTGALLDPPPALQAQAATSSGTNRWESVRAEVKSLVTRLPIESPASRIAELDSLGEREPLQPFDQERDGMEEREGCIFGFHG